MICRQSVLLVSIFFLSESATNAHDLWLIPPAQTKLHRRVIIHANVGMDFPNSVAAPDAKKYPRKFTLQPDGKTVALQSMPSSKLSGVLQFEPPLPGIYVIAVETTPKILELDADAFNEYLVTDGLPHIFRLRVKEKTLDQPAKEQYRKSPTALVLVGAGAAGDWNKPLGLPLQIVPLQNPFERKAGDTLRVRVYLQKEALAGANLGWQRPGDGDTAGGTVRTDIRGEALIPIAGAGLMTIRLTHMTRPKMPDYEWESFWTTLTFRVP
jgi:uncharacterized GH25 family protein